MTLEKLQEEDLPRNCWKLARVIDTSVDDDGLVRKAKVQIGDKNLSKDGKRKNKLSTIERPIQKLVVLYENL